MLSVSFPYIRTISTIELVILEHCYNTTKLCDATALFGIFLETNKHQNLMKHRRCLIAFVKGAFLEKKAFHIASIQFLFFLHSFFSLCVYFCNWPFVLYFCWYNIEGMYFWWRSSKSRCELWCTTIL